MLRYAITDRAQYSGNEEQRQDALVRDAARWAAQGINFVQIREKDLAAGPLTVLCRRILVEVRGVGTGTKVLVNSRADVAVAVGADGVHLTSSPEELTIAQVKQVYAAAGRPGPVVSISCHTLDDVRHAAEGQPDAILFGPVFEKVAGQRVISTGTGVEHLRSACELSGAVKVFALGGVTPEDVPTCEAAGSAGVAAIRLFSATSA
jgi:thiamine-phosphate pyrophosphorylase